MSKSSLLYPGLPRCSPVGGREAGNGVRSPTTGGAGWIRVCTCSGAVQEVWPCEADLMHAMHCALQDQAQFGVRCTYDHLWRYLSLHGTDEIRAVTTAQAVLIPLRLCSSIAIRPPPLTIMRVPTRH